MVEVDSDQDLFSDASSDTMRNKKSRYIPPAKVLKFRILFVVYFNIFIL